MRTVFIDSDYKCHVASGETTMGVKTDFFDGKCDEFVEGYRFVPRGHRWQREDGVVFNGEMIAPWRPYSELDATQRAFELEQLADMRSALELLGVTPVE